MERRTVTLELGEALYDTARRVAELTGQPLHAVLETSIARALPPLDDVPEPDATDLASLALLDDGGLWHVARAEMGANEQAELHELLDRQGSGELTATEQARLQQLLETYGRLAVRRAHAYLLLARRGYQVPPQDGLS